MSNKKDFHEYKTFEEYWGEQPFSYKLISFIFMQKKSLRELFYSLQEEVKLIRDIK